jgi:hypothetical protein
MDKAHATLDTLLNLLNIVVDLPVSSSSKDVARDLVGKLSLDSAYVMKEIEFQDEREGALYESKDGGFWHENWGR